MLIYQLKLDFYLIIKVDIDEESINIDFEDNIIIAIVRSIKDFIIVKLNTKVFNNKSFIAIYFNYKDIIVVK